MKKVLLALLGIMLLSVLSCEKKPVDYLANTVWEGDKQAAAYGVGRLEFLGNGKIVWISSYNTYETYEGTYRIVDDSHITFNLSNNDLRFVEAALYVSTMDITFFSTHYHKEAKGRFIKQ